MLIFSPNIHYLAIYYFTSLNIVDNTQAQYVQVQQQPGGLNYFDRYSAFIPGIQTRQLFQDPQVYFKEAEKFVGKSFAEFLQLANKYKLLSSTYLTAYLKCIVGFRVDPEFDLRDQDNQLLEFSKNFEDVDSNYKFEQLRQKKVPPTRAYVTLLSLYDALNKESKRLMLNKFAVSLCLIID